MRIGLLALALGCSWQITTNERSASGGATDAASELRPDAAAGGDDRRPTAPADAGARPSKKQLDLLFVIDNSPGMGIVQERVLCTFPRWVNVLRGLPGGMPDLHVAVVSTDLGAGATGAPTCDARGGDDGVMQARARPGFLDCSPTGSLPLDFVGCRGPDDGKAFLRYHSERDNNLGGQELSVAFACIANLGTGGCEFEHPLAALRRALERAVTPDQTDPNHGFLRRDATLLVVIVTDEDDCSAPPSSRLFESGPDADREHGPLGSFRCTERGILCSGAPPPRGPSGDLQRCASNESGLLYPVGQIAADIQQLKPAALTLVEVIAGWPPPEGRLAVQTEDRDGVEVPVLAPSCDVGFVRAAPAVRLQQFARAWVPGKQPILACQESYADALSALATTFRSGLPHQPVSR